MKARALAGALAGRDVRSAAWAARLGVLWRLLTLLERWKGAVGVVRRGLARGAASGRSATGG